MAYQGGERELVVLDCRMEFLELQRLEGPAEVFAVDVCHAGSNEALTKGPTAANRLHSIHGVLVPEHGAFVARILPDPHLVGITWSCPSCMHTYEIIVPPHEIGVGGKYSLGDVQDDLVLLTEDWWILGLRYAFDIEQRALVHNLGFQALAASHLRCFVIPCPEDCQVRVLLTTCSPTLVPLISHLPILDAAEPPALDLLRDAVAFPQPGEWVPTYHPRDTNDKASARARCADGLFAYQRCTVQWMQGVEAGSHLRHNDFNTEPSSRLPVHYAGRMFFPGGGECLIADHERFGPIAAEQHPLPPPSSSSSTRHQPPPASPSFSDTGVPLGGLVAHPVGAGKTVIAAELIRRDAPACNDPTPASRVLLTEPEVAGAGVDESGGASRRDRSSGLSGGSACLSRGAHTLVVCPEHIVHQWVSAVRRFAPGVSVREFPLSIPGPRTNPSTPMDSYEVYPGNTASPTSVTVIGYDTLTTIRMQVRVHGGEDDTNPGARTGREQEDTHALSMEGCDEMTAQRLILTDWHRIVVDEPQEVVDHKECFEAVLGLRARHRWALSATPNEQLHEIMSLVHGCQLDRGFYRSSRATWARHLARRDPPSQTLPVPPLIQHTVPVVPSWYEASVLRFYSEMDASIEQLMQLCTFFSGQSNLEDETGTEPWEEVSSTFASLDEWYNHHHALHTGRLVKLQSSMDSVREALERLEGAICGEDANAANVYNPVTLLDDLFDQDFFQELDEHMDEFSMEFENLQGSRSDCVAAEDGDAPVNANTVPEGNRAAAEALREELRKLEMASESHKRALHFVTVTANSLHNPNAECAVCYEPLQGQQVSVLRCMHVFDGHCVGHMLGFTAVGGGMSRAVVTCPLCRVSTRRRDMSTFLHQAPQGAEVPLKPHRDPQSGGRPSSGLLRLPRRGATGGAQEHKLLDIKSSELDPIIVDQSGTKVAALVHLLQGILARSGEKVLVFSQWPGVLSAIATILDVVKIAHCVLLGPAIQRAAALEAFQDDSGPHVLLLSYKQHASGLNLHQANHCIMLHPYCTNDTISSNLTEAQAYERQAVGRIRRYPQTEPCHVYRLFMRGTIEEELYGIWGFI